MSSSINYTVVFIIDLRSSKFNNISTFNIDVLFIRVPYRIFCITALQWYSVYAKELQVLNIYISKAERIVSYLYFILAGFIALQSINHS